MNEASFSQQPLAKALESKRRFTAEARREALRDGVPPIELVDGDKLLDMFEQLELGLKPIAAYEVDRGFFDEFRSR